MGREDATLLFIIAQFAHQHYNEDNWQNQQREHEEKSEAHHGEVSPFVAYLASIYIQLVKIRYRWVKGFAKILNASISTEQNGFGA